MFNWTNEKSYLLETEFKREDNTFLRILSNDEFSNDISLIYDSEVNPFIITIIDDEVKLFKIDEMN